jgi:VWFA-related protein
MSKLIIFLITPFCFLFTIASSQTIQGPSQAQSSQSAPKTQDDVIRVSTELVQTDVTVLDKQGRFVDGLDREKFELKINGKEQPIVFFERVIAGSSKEVELLTSTRSGPNGSRDKESPTTGETTSTGTDRGRTVFLFIDDHHLSANSMVRTRDLLLNYVDNLMGPKDQTVIATASGQLGFLQQLTGDI